jgi:anti-sigma factor RsiW
MCDFERKLIAWLDQELSENEAAAVALHLQTCAECRGQVEAFRQVSGAFDRYCDAYCDAVVASRPGRKISRRVLTISGGAAVAAAALAVFFLLAPQAPVQQSPTLAKVTTPAEIDVAKPVPPVQAAQPAAAAVKPVSRTERHSRPGQGKQSTVQRQREETSWVASEPAVEIAIPADAIFPPGAVPEGVGFTADITIAPDGSAQQIRLQPQLAEFERRPTRP